MYLKVCVVLQVRKPRVMPVWQASHDGAVAYYKHGDESRNPFATTEASASVFDMISQYEAPDLHGQTEAEAAK